MEQRIGRQVTAWRRRRGMTQRMLADPSGLSQGYISKIESGQKPLDRKSTQVAIASALNISVAQLLGQPTENGDPIRQRVTMHIPAIRSTLIELSAGERRKPIRDQDTLRRAVREMTDVTKGADYAAAAPVLPALLIDVAGHGEAMTPEFVESLHAMLDVLKATGWRDLALMAAELSLRAAGNYGHPAWLGFATFSWVQAFPAENADLGMRTTARIADGMQAAANRQATEMYGHLQLLSALQAAVAMRSDDAQARLSEATTVARFLGEPTPYSRLSAGIGGLWFGPTNVDMWRVAIAAELADAATVLTVSDRINLSMVPVPERWGHFHIDQARALATGKHDREAMYALAKAEHAAPQHMRFNAVARDLMATLRRRAKRRADAQELTALARRLGLDTL